MEPLTVEENTHKRIQYMYIPSPSRSATSLTSGDLADVSSSLSKSSVSSGSLGSKISLRSSASLENTEQNESSTVTKSTAGRVFIGYFVYTYLYQQIKKMYIFMLYQYTTQFITILKKAFKNIFGKGENSLSANAVNLEKSNTFLFDKDLICYLTFPSVHNTNEDGSRKHCRKQKNIN